MSPAPEMLPLSSEHCIWKGCNLINNYMYSSTFSTSVIDAISDGGKHDKHAKADKEDKKLKQKISQLNSSQVNLRCDHIVTFRNLYQ